MSPAQNENYLRQFLGWLLRVLHLEQRGINRVNPVSEILRNPRLAENTHLAVAYPTLLRLNRDSAGRDTPIATYKGLPAESGAWDCWFICDRLHRASSTQQEIRVGSGNRSIRVRVLDESTAPDPNSDVATSYSKQPTHRFVVFLMSQIPDESGSYKIKRLFYGELNMVNSFQLYDALAARLTRKLAQKIFWAFPEDLDWKKEVELERAKLSSGFA